MSEQDNRNDDQQRRSAVDEVSEQLEGLLKTLGEVRKVRESQWAEGVSRLEVRRRELHDAISELKSLDDLQSSQLSSLVDMGNSLGEFTKKMRAEFERLEAKRREDAMRVERAEMAVVVAEEAADSQRQRAERLEKQSAELTETVARLEEKLVDQQADVERMQQEVQQAAEQLNESVEALTAISLERGELLKAKEELEGKLRASEEQIHLMTADHQQAQSTWEALERDLNAELEKLRVERDDRERSYGELQQEMEKQRDQFDRQRAEVEKQVEQMRAQRDAAVQERNTFAESVKELQVQLQSAQAEQQPVGTDRNGDTEALLRQVERLERELAESREGLDQLLKDCDRLTFENIRLKANQRDGSALSAHSSALSESASSRGEPSSPMVQLDTEALGDTNPALDLVDNAAIKKAEDTSVVEGATAHEEPLTSDASAVSTPVAASGEVPVRERPPTLGGSYSIVGEGISEETLAARRRRRAKKKKK